MKKATALSLVLLCAGSVQAALTFDIPAQFTPYSAPFDTGVTVTVGDTVIISTDPLDTWSLGHTADRIGNADGLPAYPELTIGSTSMLYGTLVAQISSGDYIKVGVSNTFTAPNGGTLKLMNWDKNYVDNTDSITAETSVIANPVPSAFLLTAFGTAVVGSIKRRRMQSVNS